MDGTGRGRRESFELRRAHTPGLPIRDVELGKAERGLAEGDGGAALLP